MNGKMLLGVFALMLAAANALNTCPAILHGSFTRVFQGTPPSGWHLKDYNDASWKVVSFPLASCPNCFRKLGKQPSSFFDPKQMLISRTVFEPTRGVWGGQLNIRASNKARIYVNGVHVADIHNPASCTGFEGFPLRTIHIAEHLLRVGANTIAVKAVATGDQAYLDVQLAVKQKISCLTPSAVLQCPVIGQGSATRTTRYPYAAQPPIGSLEVYFNDTAFRTDRFPLGEYVERCERTACLDIKGWLPATNDKTLTRTEFFLPRVPGYDAYLRVSAVKAWVSVNGVRLGDVHSNDCKWMEMGKFFVIPKSLLRRGKNVLAVIVAGQVENGVSLALPELNIRDTSCRVVDVDVPYAEEEDYDNPYGLPQLDAGAPIQRQQKQ